MRILTDNPRVVGVFDILHQHIRIMVYEIIDILASEKERRYDFACVDFLGSTVDDPCLDEPQQSVRKHFRMQAEVFVA